MINKELNRKIYKYCGIFLVCLLTFAVGIGLKKLNYKRTLLSEGIRTKAQVINKYHLKTNTGKIKKSYIELAVFEDTTNIAIQEVISIKRKSKSLNDKIDNLFENFGSKNTPIGDYKTVKILVSLERFGATKIGDRKTFVYLKKEIKKGILLEILE